MFHFNFNGLVIHIDPYEKLADFSELPEADLILITHQHRDHLDQAAPEKITKTDADFIVTKTVFEKLGKGTVMNNGDSLKIRGINIEAIPAYNIVHKRDNGKFYHPKGEGDGYILTMGDKRIYLAGDTENIPEMDLLKNMALPVIVREQA